MDDFRFLVTDKEDGLVVQVFGGGDNFAGFSLATLKEEGTTFRRRSAFRLGDTRSRCCACSSATTGHVMPASSWPCRRSGRVPQLLRFASAAWPIGRGHRILRRGDELRWSGPETGSLLERPAAWEAGKWITATALVLLYLLAETIMCRLQPFQLLKQLRILGDLTFELVCAGPQCGTDIT